MLLEPGKKAHRIRADAAARARNLWLRGPSQPHVKGLRAVSS